MPAPLQRHAVANAVKLKELGERLMGKYKSDDEGAAIDKYRDDLHKALLHFHGAVQAADKKSKEVDEGVWAGVRASSQELSRIKADIGSLAVVHSAIAEFLSIDLLGCSMVTTNSIRPRRWGGWS